MKYFLAVAGGIALLFWGMLSLAGAMERIAARENAACRDAGGVVHRSRDGILCLAPNAIIIPKTQ